MSHKTAIVLDLDATLVETAEPCSLKTPSTPTPWVGCTYSFVAADDAGQAEAVIWGTIRPHHRSFLQWAHRTFDYVVVWSAGQRNYVHELVAVLWKGLPRKPDLVLTYNDLDTRNGIYTKPLKRVCDLLEVSLSRVVLIDDNPDVSVDNPDNAVVIPPYTTATHHEDDYLVRLINMLDIILDVPANTDCRSLGLRSLFMDHPHTSAIHFEVNA